MTGIDLRFHDLDFLHHHEIECGTEGHAQWQLGPSELEPLAAEGKVGRSNGVQLLPVPRIHPTPYNGRIKSLDYHRRAIADPIRDVQVLHAHDWHANAQRQ